MTALVALVLVEIAVAPGVIHGPPPAHAQGSALVPKPWRPSPGDTISIWVHEAQALLQGAKASELGPGEVRAYGLLDRIARAYFQELGPHRMSAGVGIRVLFDSLGIQAKVSQAERFPPFVLIHYLNPHYENAASLAYLYWFRGSEVRSQPVNLHGGGDPTLDVYWTGEEEGPYEAGVLFYQGIGRQQEPGLYLFRLVRTGAAWLPVQTGDKDIDLGRRGSAAWADLDRDGKPELISWTEGLLDSLFAPCDQLGCPEILTERIFVRSSAGFRLYDQRAVASPFATFVLFLRALSQGDETFAQTLTHGTGVMAKARELGWVGLTRARAFRPLASTTLSRWPDRLRFDYGAPGGYATLVEARFVNRQGHWLIDEVAVLRQAEQKQSQAPPPGAPSPSGAPSRGRP